ncbi:MAG: hypothetical protein J0L92_09480 [Deltaproteobacteria bacterium]|nr:hypothetical protein [Deltaproteobacteria bacterium]
MSVRPSCALLVAITLTACGTTSAGTTTEEPRPFHPSCDESCRGHCEDTPEACAARCQIECAPAPSDSARVTQAWRAERLGAASSSSSAASACCAWSS